MATRDIRCILRRFFDSYLPPSKIKRGNDVDDDVADADADT